MNIQIVGLRIGALLWAGW